jgi:hypothetical protein
MKYDGLVTTPMIYSETRMESKTECDCIVCGKPTSAIRWIHIIDGGGMVLHPLEEENYRARFSEEGDSADLGLQPIGSDCARKFPKEFIQ